MVVTPDVYVVVVSFRDPALLAQCLEALRPQCARTGAELVVARAGESAGLPQECLDGVETVPGPLPTAVPQLRGAGIALAKGSIVLVTEDHCVPADDWV